MPMTDALRTALPGVGLDLADVTAKVVTCDDFGIGVIKGRRVRVGPRQYAEWYGRIEIWPRGVGLSTTVDTMPCLSPEAAAVELGLEAVRLRATLASMIGEGVAL